MTDVATHPVLYGMTVSPFSMRVFMQIRLKRLPIDMIDPSGGTHSPEYKALNPIDKIPTLVVDGTPIPESEVIGHLLERLFPETPLVPADPVEEAKVRLIARVLDTYVMSSLLPLMKPGPDFDDLQALAHIRRNYEPSTRDDLIAERMRKQLGWGLGWLDHFISPGPYAYGSTATLADCAAVPILTYVEYFAPKFGATDPFAGHNTVERYWRAVSEDAVAAEVVATMQATFTAYGI